MGGVGDVRRALLIFFFLTSGKTFKNKSHIHEGPGKNDRWGVFLTGMWMWLPTGRFQALVVLRIKKEEE